jgi:16S rRNA (adenine1518-N6/adenine1519-N6)-dimethyltransferase
MRAGAAPSTRAQVRATLASLGVAPTKRWGQSFLTDPFVADAEAALVELPPGRPVLEIGGGLGILTEALLRRGLGPITVVEKDARLAAYLATTFVDRVQVRAGDALEIDLPDAECVVGNLPYAVATPILLRLFARRVPRVVALLQQEVAARLAAGPDSKEYGRLAIYARLFGTVELYRSVGAAAFEPRPEVDSQIVVHTARAGLLPVPSIPLFERAVRELFSSRRKQLGNLLPRLARAGLSAGELASRAGWPTDWEHRRPENLPPEAYFALARVLSAP